MIKNVVGSEVKLVLIFFALLLLLPCSNADAGGKKVAVMDFEDAAVQAHAHFKDLKIGRAVADILVTELVKDGTFKVVERSQLEKVLSEQKLSMSGLMDVSEASKLGKVLGVSGIIVGSVTQFGLDASSFQIPFFGFGVKKSIAKVSVNARLIDTASAEILCAAEGAGEESSSAVSVEGLGNIDNTGISNTILGTAVKLALGDVVKQLKEQASKLKDAVINAKVAYVDPKTKTYLIDAGRDAGVASGAVFYAVKVTKEIKSPTTGAVIKRMTDVVAELKVTETDSASATLTCVSGNCDVIKENDDVSTSR